MCSYIVHTIKKEASLLYSELSADKFDFSNDDDWKEVDIVGSMNEALDENEGRRLIFLHFYIILLTMLCSLLFTSAPFFLRKHKTIWNSQMPMAFRYSVLLDIASIF